MNEENTEELIGLAPDMFRENFRFQCGDGWRGIIEAVIRFASSRSKRWERKLKTKKRVEDEGTFDPTGAHSWIVDYFEENPEDPWKGFEFTQIKEKFGGLRVYTNFIPSPELRGAISVAEITSYTVCEFCGAPGEERPGGWVKTLCDSCEENRQKED